MHSCTLVIGDVKAQMAPLTGEDETGWCDWWQIGGRFTGRLMLKPGAAGKVYDARVSATVRRPMAGLGDGVDQARSRDLEDIRAHRFAVVVVGGVVHEPDADEEKACQQELAAKTGRPLAEVMPRWVERVNELLASADPDELVTVVDVHW